MRVFKNTNIYFIVLPRVIVETKDAISSFMLNIIKLTAIKESVTKQYVKETLGFPDEIVDALFTRLLKYGLVKTTSKDQTSFKLTTTGQNHIEQDTEAVYFAKELDLRLIIIDEPYFVLRHHWYYPPQTFEKITEEHEKNLTIDKIKSRSGYSGLHKFVKTLTYPPKIMSIVPTTVSFVLETKIPTKLTYNDNKGKKRIIASTSADPDINSTHERLWELLKPSEKNKTFEQLILQNTEYLEFLAFNIDSTANNIIIKPHLSTDELTIEEHLKWIAWLRKNKLKRKTLVLQLEVYKGWFIELQASLELDDTLLLYGMLVLELADGIQSLKEFIWEISVLDYIEEHWFNLNKLYDIEENKFAEDILMDILWEYSIEGKILRSKMLEDEIFNT